MPRNGTPPAIVLDAFALGSLPELADELGPWAGRLILTPNITEAGILLGRDVDDLHRDVPDMADKYQAVVSCRGSSPPRAAAGPARAVRDGDGGGTGRPVGNHHRAQRAGHLGQRGRPLRDHSGLRARGTTDAQATCWGTHLHAAAGDRLASRLGGLGLPRPGTHRRTAAAHDGTFRLSGSLQGPRLWTASSVLIRLKCGPAAPAARYR